MSSFKSKDSGKEENVMNQKQPLEAGTASAMLTDLPLPGEEAEQAKAGSGGVTLIGPPETVEPKKVREGGLIYSGEPG